jgi:hypothetical protein
MTGAGPPLRRPTFGCLTLRGFRRVSTTEDRITRFFSPAVLRKLLHAYGPGSNTSRLFTGCGGYKRVDDRRAHASKTGKRGAASHPAG